MNNKLKLILFLFFLGVAGILTLLAADLPMGDLPEEAKEIPPHILKLLMLVNPAVLVLIAVITGTFLHEKVGYDVPAIKALLHIKPAKIPFISQLKAGVIAGIISGVLIVITSFIFKNIVTAEMNLLNKGASLPPIVRFGYGGITEEILMRYGLMTLISWVIFKISKKLNSKIHWISIVISSLIFAVGHFPVVFASVPNPSTLLLSYIIIGNTVGGLFFGYVYWKKGLEAAFAAHIFAHVVMLAANYLSIN